MLVAYVDPFSSPPASDLRVMVSCHAEGTYRADLVKLICGDDRPRGDNGTLTSLRNHERLCFAHHALVHARQWVRSESASLRAQLGGWDLSHLDRGCKARIDSNAVAVGPDLQRTRQMPMESAESPKHLIIRRLLSPVDADGRFSRSIRNQQVSGSSPLVGSMIPRSYGPDESCVLRLVRTGSVFRHQDIGKAAHLAGLNGGLTASQLVDVRWLPMRIRKAALLITTLVAACIPTGGLDLLESSASSPHRRLLQRELIDVGGYRLFFSCSPPAPIHVVFETGGGSVHLLWKPLQEALLSNSGVQSCSYDRAGHGWSEAVSRTVQHQTRSGCPSSRLIRAAGS